MSETQEPNVEEPMPADPGSEPGDGEQPEEPTPAEPEEGDGEDAGEPEE